MNWAVDMVTERYVDEESRHIDVQYLDGGSCTTSDIIGASKAYSMFSERRVIVVRNYLPVYRKAADAGNEALIEAAKASADADGTSPAVVIFVLESRYESDITSFGKKLMKACSAYSFDRLDRGTLRAFITKRIHSAGKVIGRRELEYLMDLTGYFYKDSGYNLDKLASDIEKITGACEGDEIKAPLIEELLVGEEDKYVFSLVDALMAGNRKRAMEYAETLITENDASMQIIALLVKQFEIMYDALELSEEGYSVPQMAKKTGVNEFRFKKAYQAAMNYRKDKIRKLLIRLYNIDLDIKTGNLDKDIAFELFVTTA